jgi:hypothetical protein
LHNATTLARDDEFPMNKAGERTEAALCPGPIPLSHCGCALLVVVLRVLCDSAGADNIAGGFVASAQAPYAAASVAEAAGEEEVTGVQVFYTVATTTEGFWIVPKAYAT